jgi:hypothetical protein
MERVKQLKPMTRWHTPWFTMEITLPALARIKIQPRNEQLLSKVWLKW